MALTRKMLKAMGIEEEKIDQIIEAHTETVDGLKDKLDENKDAADKLAAVTKELETAKEQLENSSTDAYKAKYDALKEEFDGYKADITAKETKQAKETAYKALLVDAGINSKRIDTVMKCSADVIGSAELKDGKFVDVDKLVESIKADWADFITTDGQQGADVSNPPDNTGGASIKVPSIF